MHTPHGFALIYNRHFEAHFISRQHHHQNNASLPQKGHEPHARLKKSGMKGDTSKNMVEPLSRWNLRQAPQERKQEHFKRISSVLLIFLLPQLIYAHSYRYADRCKQASRMNGVATRHTRSFVRPLITWRQPSVKCICIPYTQTGAALQRERDGEYNYPGGATEKIGKSVTEMPHRLMLATKHEERGSAWNDCASFDKTTGCRC